MTIANVEIVTATPDILDEAASASVDNFTRQNTWWAKVERMFTESCAYCVGTGASGVLASHGGCLVAPIVTTLASGGTSMIGHNPLVMTAVGAGINLATLGTWYGLRGRHMAKPIRALTFGIAAAGFLGTTAYNWRDWDLSWQFMKDLCITQPYTSAAANPDEAKIKDAFGKVRFRVANPQGPQP